MMHVILHMCPLDHNRTHQPAHQEAGVVADKYHWLAVRQQILDALYLHLAKWMEDGFGPYVIPKMLCTSPERGGKGIGC